MSKSIIALLILVFIGVIFLKSNYFSEKETCPACFDSNEPLHNYSTREECLTNSDEVSSSFFEKAKRTQVMTSIDWHLNCLKILSGEKAWIKVDDFLEKYYSTEVEKPDVEVPVKIFLVKQFLKIKPNDKKKNEKLILLEKQYERETKLEQVKRRKIVEAEDKVSRKLKASKGVGIGMTTKDVLESSWGKPESVHKTTSGLGKSELWIYPGGNNSLYFVDGILVTIQH